MGSDLGNLGLPVYHTQVLRGAGLAGRPEQEF